MSARKPYIITDMGRVDSVSEDGSEVLACFPGVEGQDNSRNDKEMRVPIPAELLRQAGVVLDCEPVYFWASVNSAATTPDQVNPTGFEPVPNATPEDIAAWLGNPPA